MERSRFLPHVNPSSAATVSQPSPGRAAADVAGASRVPSAPKLSSPQQRSWPLPTAQVCVELLLGDVHPAAAARVVVFSVHAVASHIGVPHASDPSVRLPQSLPF